MRKHQAISVLLSAVVGVMAAMTVAASDDVPIHSQLCKHVCKKYPGESPNYCLCEFYPTHLSIDGGAG